MCPINIVEWLTYNIMTQLLSYYFSVTFVNNFILLLFWKTCLETDYSQITRVIQSNCRIFQLNLVLIKLITTSSLLILKSNYTVHTYRNIYIYIYNIHAITLVFLIIITHETHYNNI